MKEIYPNYSEPSFKTRLFFEINSWIGRKCCFRSSRFPSEKSPYYIDIGAGSNYTNNWVHVDFFRNRIRKFWKNQKTIRRPEVETDLRYPLNCQDNIADGIYSGHTLEHLYPNHAYQLLSEIYRILKPGGWLRINVPDLKKAVDYYLGKIQVEEWTYKYKGEAIANLTQNYGHHSVWDQELLINALKLSGFTNVKEVEFGKEGADKRLIKEEEVRKHETLVVEAQKPKIQND